MNAGFIGEPEEVGVDRGRLELGTTASYHGLSGWCILGRIVQRSVN